MYILRCSPFLEMSWHFSRSVCADLPVLSRFTVATGSGSTRGSSAQGKLWRKRDITSSRKCWRLILTSNRLLITSESLSNVSEAFTWTRPAFIRLFYAPDRPKLVNRPIRWGKFLEIESSHEMTCIYCFKCAESKPAVVFFRFRTPVALCLVLQNSFSVK